MTKSSGIARWTSNARQGSFDRVDLQCPRTVAGTAVDAHAGVAASAGYLLQGVVKPSPRLLKALLALAVLTLSVGLSIPAGGGMFPDWVLFIAILIVTAISFTGFKVEAGYNLKTVRRGVFSFALFLACAAAWIPDLGGKFPSWVWSVTGLAVFFICLLGTIDFLHEETNP